MNAVVRALFDDAAITGAQAAGLKDTSTAAMRAAVREWFELFFMREAVKGKDEDPAQRIPYTITNKLTKACFAEYDSSFTETPPRRASWRRTGPKIHRRLPHRAHSRHKNLSRICSRA